MILVKFLCLILIYKILSRSAHIPIQRIVDIADILIFSANVSPGATANIITAAIITHIGVIRSLLSQPRAGFLHPHKTVSSQSLER